MPILNYTTSISTEKTIGEIQRLLGSAKAMAVLTEYDPHGNVEAISFRVMGPFGILSFRLPANVDKIFMVVQRDPKIPKWNRTREQATRVAWRIIKDWLEAQLALLKAEMVTIDQLFLPYMQDSDGIPLYEKLTSQKFNGLALPVPKQA